MLKKWIISASFLLALLGAPYLFADDHEEDEHEEHEYSRERKSLFVTSNVPSATNSKWKAECSSCHMLFPPALLPARSWTKLMGGLDKHFGEDASIDAKTRDEITGFLVANGADRSSNRRGTKIDQSISSGNVPIRITETPYFIRKHDEIQSSVWKRPKIKSPANCVACHRNAEQGVFSEHEVSIPK